MQIEKESKKRRFRVNLKQIMLATIGTAGLLSVVALAPNMFQILPNLGSGQKRRAKLFETSLERLLSDKLVMINKTNNGKFIQLTEKGKFELQRLTQGEWKNKRRKRWDGKWRVIIFDIPEFRKKDRYKITRILKQLGFFRLQDSVWVYPDDCEDLIKIMKADLKIGLAVTYIIADSIEGDGKVAEFFGVKRSWLFAK